MKIQIKPLLIFAVAALLFVGIALALSAAVQADTVDDNPAKGVAPSSIADSAGGKGPQTTPPHAAASNASSADEPSKGPAPASEADEDGPKSDFTPDYQAKINGVKQEDLDKKQQAELDRARHQKAIDASIRN